MYFSCFESTYFYFRYIYIKHISVQHQQVSFHYTASQGFVEVIEYYRKQKESMLFIYIHCISMFEKKKNKRWHCCVCSWFERCQQELILSSSPLQKPEPNLPAVVSRQICLRSVGWIRERFRPLGQNLAASWQVNQLGLYGSIHQLLCNNGVFRKTEADPKLVFFYENFLIIQVTQRTSQNYFRCNSVTLSYSTRDIYNK